MSDKITIPDIAQAIEMTKKIAPIMNNNEYVSLMLFFNQVLDRYQKEIYLDGLPEEVEQEAE